MTSIPVYTREEIDALTDWGAKMVSRQFLALETRLRLEDIVRDLASAPDRTRSPADGEMAHMEACLRNGWSTEALLRGNRDVFQGRELAYALHWALAQAYYSVHAIVRAYFAARGATERTHATVIRRVGADMADGKYPKAVSFLATGGMDGIAFRNLEPSPADSTLHLDCDDPGSVDNQIAQFLRATRKKDLDSKKSDMRFKTKRGKPKKRFSPEDWARVSEKLGYTSLLSLLYRNRIRANYGEIDTFLSPELDTERVFASLVHVTDTLNLVHEAKLWATLGGRTFEELSRRSGARGHSFVGERASTLRAL